MSVTVSQTFNEAMEEHVRNVLDHMLMGIENYFGAEDPKRNGRVRLAMSLIVREIVEQAQKAAAAEREAIASMIDDFVWSEDITWWLQATKKEASAESCRRIAAAVRARGAGQRDMIPIPRTEGTMAQLAAIMEDRALRAEALIQAIADLEPGTQEWVDGMRPGSETDLLGKVFGLARTGARS